MGYLPDKGEKCNQARNLSLRVLSHSGRSALTRGRRSLSMLTLSRLAVRAPRFARALSYPTHTVVSMPALSPTMTQGNIAKYVAAVGDTISAGDRLAEIETDKATVDFEMVDDGVLAKILLPEGAQDVPVGTRQWSCSRGDAADVAAFRDFSAGAAPSAPAGAGGRARRPPPLLRRRLRRRRPPPPPPQRRRSPASRCRGVWSHLLERGEGLVPRVSEEAPSADSKGLLGRVERAAPRGTEHCSARPLVREVRAVGFLWRQRERARAAVGSPSKVHREIRCVCYAFTKNRQ